MHDMVDIPKPCRNDRFAHLVGIQISSCGEGWARARLELREEHLNGMDRVQGGVIFTLADYCFAVACNRAGSTAVGLSNTITYFRPPKGSFLTAEATMVHSGKRIGAYTVLVNDEDGTLVAKMECLAYGKG